jgi:hypothetical protein
MTSWAITPYRNCRKSSTWAVLSSAAVSFWKSPRKTVSFKIHHRSNPKGELQSTSYLHFCFLFPLFLSKNIKWKSSRNTHLYILFSSLLLLLHLFPCQGVCTSIVCICRSGDTRMSWLSPSNQTQVIRLGGRPWLTEPASQAVPTVWTENCSAWRSLETSFYSPQMSYSFGQDSHTVYMAYSVTSLAAQLSIQYAGSVLRNLSLHYVGVALEHDSHEKGVEEWGLQKSFWLTNNTNTIILKPEYQKGKLRNMRIFKYKIYTVFKNHVNTTFLGVGGWEAGDRVSLCSPGCSGTHSVDQAGLELRNPSASASQVLGLKACTTTAQLCEYNLSHGVNAYILIIWKAGVGGSQAGIHWNCLKKPQKSMLGIATHTFNTNIWE